MKDVNERTPLDLAEEYQHEECIQLLKVMSKIPLILFTIFTKFGKMSEKSDARKVIIFAV